MTSTERVAWKPRAWADAVSIGLTSVWALIGRREIETMKIGSTTLIVTPPGEWIARKLEEYRAAGTPLPSIRREEKAAAPAPSESRRGRPRKYPRAQ